MSFLVKDWLSGCTLKRFASAEDRENWLRENTVETTSNPYIYGLLSNGTKITCVNA